MIGFVLILLGVVGLLATVTVARLTKRRAASAPTEGIDAFAPRPVGEVESERTRWWPLAAILVSLFLVTAGLASSRYEPVPDRPVVDAAAAPAATPFHVTLQVSTGDPPSPSPSPSSTPSATPAPTPEDATSASRPVAAPTAAPTPVPTPKPGPGVSANTSCFEGALQIGYSVNARSGTTISDIVVTLDGRVVDNPEAGGQRQHSGNYQTQAAPGEHEVVVRATGSDGGQTHRHYPVTCS